MAQATAAKKATKKSAVKAAPKKAVTKKATPAKKTTQKVTAKKVAAKTTAPGEKKELSVNIKYNDKSAGQPELVVIFEKIRKMMAPYDRKRALVLHSKPSQALLVSHKPVTIDGRPRKELWFVSALVQKGYVGFYYMPIYAESEMRKHFSEAFLKTLKGKACFHIKKDTPEMMSDIKKAIDLGYKEYAKREWI